MLRALDLHHSEIKLVAALGVFAEFIAVELELAEQLVEPRIRAVDSGVRFVVGFLAHGFAFRVAVVFGLKVES